MSGPQQRHTVLLVEDDEPLRAATAQALDLAGFTPLACPSAEQALRKISAEFAGCVVTDIRMEGMDGLELMRAIQAVDPEIPVILVTGHGDVPMAVASLKDGAFDFLAKPFAVDQLNAAVRRALQSRALVLENRHLRLAADEAGSGELAGSSEAMAKLRTTVGQMAMIDLDVLLEGESGTGKELAARELHRRSGRALMPFTALRCSALGERGLGELFGTSETGPGLMRHADGGVLFLDEIDALEISLQARLLAQLENRERQDSAERSGVRVIAATRVNLEDEVREGRFREDLYYRLAGLRVRIPPLRERREDIPVLFAQFVREALDRTRRKRFDLSASDRRRLLEYNWPGNARELRSYAYNAVLGLPRSAASETTPSGGLAAQMAAYERTILVEAIQQTGGKVSDACRILNISRQTFYEKVARHRLQLQRYRARQQG
jgi:two-component system, NtrC family, C4-dicarboxylate transport response regulator DctD